MMKKIIFLMVFILMLILFVSCSCEDEGITDTSDSVNCEHYWDKGKITKPATEETPGEMVYACLLCGGERTEGIPKLAHNHTYGDNWETDRMNHWHACGVKNCTVKGEKGAHTWSEGEIVTEADQTTTGVKKYTCTVCAYEKEEQYRASAQVTKEEFEIAIRRDAFLCVTYTATSSDNSIKVEIANGYVLLEGNVMSDNEACGYGSYHIAKQLNGIDFDSLSYDSEARAYYYAEEGFKISLQFADGRISVMNVTRENISVKYKFSKYDRTSFEIE